MRILSAFIIICLVVTAAFASEYEGIYKKYPLEKYLVGVSEVESSGDSYKDRRRTEILARLEIAKVIRVKIKQTTIDVMCEGPGTVVYASIAECRNQFVMVVEETVDEVLYGSRIVEAGLDEGRGIYFAVAVMLISEASGRAGEGVKRSIVKAKELVDKAREADDPAEKKALLDRASEDYKKGMAYEAEWAAIEETRANAAGAFDELGAELKRIEQGI